MGFEVDAAMVRQDAATWGAASDEYAGISGVASGLTIDPGAFSFIGENCGVPAAYDAFRATMAALIEGGSSEFEKMGAALRAAADEYDRLDREKEQQHKGTQTGGRETPISADTGGGGSKSTGGGGGGGGGIGGGASVKSDVGQENNQQQNVNVGVAPIEPDLLDGDTSADGDVDGTVPGDDTQDAPTPKTPDQLELDADVAAARAEAADRVALDADARGDAAETRAEAADQAALDAGSRAEEAEARAEAADQRAETAEAAGDRASADAARGEAALARAEAADARADAAEARAEALDARGDAATARSDAADARAEGAHARAEAAAARAEAAELVEDEATTDADAAGEPSVEDETSADAAGAPGSDGAAVVAPGADGAAAEVGAGAPDAVAPAEPAAQPADADGTDATGGGAAVEVDVEQTNNQEQNVTIGAPALSSSLLDRLNGQPVTRA